MFRPVPGGLYQVGDNFLGSGCYSLPKRRSPMDVFAVDVKAGSQEDLANGQAVLTHREFPGFMEGIKDIALNASKYQVNNTTLATGRGLE
jgi:hypothetical protein